MDNLSKFTIRTSDRRVFRRCLRKWGWQSSLKGNLQRKGTEQNIHFWFGSAIHFAMEDYFSYNYFGDPRKAFKAYYNAFDKDTLPDGAEDAYDLGIAMLTYFLDWYPRYNKQWDFQTLWLNENNKPCVPFSEGAKPAVEQRFFIDLDIKVIVNAKTEEIICEYKEGDPQLINQNAFDMFRLADQEPEYTYMHKGKEIPIKIVPIYYHGTMDRLVIDRYGRWWILDYKTAKGADTNKLDTDDQISAYLWAAEKWFGHPIYGFVYLQLTKDIAKKPKRLKSGELSVDKKQKTTHYLVRQELINEFGSVQKAPMKYIDFLNHLAEQETPEGDRFIRWDFIQRNKEQLEATYRHIMGELQLMLNSDLYLYPNPTRDCIWDCPLRHVCLAIDDGRNSEVALILDNEYEARPRQEDGQKEEWRMKINEMIKEGVVIEDDFDIDFDGINIILPDDNKTKEE